MREPQVGQLMRSAPSGRTAAVFGLAGVSDACFLIPGCTSCEASPDCAGVGKAAPTAFAGTVERTTPGGGTSTSPWTNANPHVQMDAAFGTELPQFGQFFITI